MLKIEDVSEGVRLWLRIEPRSSVEQIVGVYNGALKIKITTPPVDGRANKRVVRIMADLLDIPLKQIEIVRGLTGKDKQVLIKDMDATAVKSKLGL